MLKRSAYAVNMFLFNDFNSFCLAFDWVRGCQSSNDSDKYSKTTQFCLEHDEKKTNKKIKNNEKKLKHWLYSLFEPLHMMSIQNGQIHN